MRVDYRFDAKIGAEIDSLQSLTSSFAAAYELCTNVGVSQKWYLKSVMMGRNDLATDVFSNGSSMTAILVGNAAHFISDILSSADIIWVVVDVMDLCYMIVERYNDDRLFSQISNDYYDIKLARWQQYLHKMEGAMIALCAITFAIVEYVGPQWLHKGAYFNEETHGPTAQSPLGSLLV